MLTDLLEASGYEHPEGSSQVHDELTLLNLSHNQRVLCTRILASTTTESRTTHPCPHVDGAKPDEVRGRAHHSEVDAWSGPPL